MTSHDITGTLLAFFAQTFPGRKLGEREDIFALGFGNSLFAMQLVEFVEREFAIEIENDDLDMDNFRTIEAMTSLVRRKAQMRRAS